MAFPDLSFLNPGVQPQVDPYQRLQEVIQGIQSQPLPVAPEMSILERILTSIAQASAVVASPDPSTVLQGQLKARADSRNAVTKAIQDRQNLVNQATLQAGFQQAEGMAREQGEIRKERRTNIADIQKEQRGIKLFKEQKNIEKDVQLATNKSLLEQNELFESTNEEARLRRVKNKAIVDLLPDKYKGAAAWEANARLIVPGVDPSVLRTIAEKDAGINPEPITTKEQEIKVKIAEASFNEAKKQRDLAESKIKADISESKGRTQAAITSANAAMISAKNQSYNNTMQNWATKQKLDIMETQFYKTPSGAVVSLEEVNKLPITEKYTTIALPANENLIEQQKRIAQINTAVGQTQTQLQKEAKEAQEGDQLNNLIQSELKTKTPEQVKQTILNSNLPQSEKERGLQILGVKPKSEDSKPKAGARIGFMGAETTIPLPTKIGFRGAEVPLSIPSAISNIPTALSEVFSTMFRKNTPEENLKLLEEYRKRGRFSEAGYNPNP